MGKQIGQAGRVHQTFRRAASHSSSNSAAAIAYSHQLMPRAGACTVLAARRGGGRLEAGCVARPMSDSSASTKLAKIRTLVPSADTRYSPAYSASMLADVLAGR